MDHWNNGPTTFFLAFWTLPHDTLSCGGYANRDEFFSESLSNSLSLFSSKDPENAQFDALSLNRGVKETFFTVSTPFAFLDRISKPDGMKDLLQVLSKWNKGMTSMTLSQMRWCYLFWYLPLLTLGEYSFYIPSSRLHSTEIGARTHARWNICL
jgi:hypothetical protein